MIAGHKGEIPFIILLIPYLLGIAFGIGCLSAAPVWLFGIAFLLLSAVFVILNLAYKKLGIYKMRWLGGVLILFTLTSAGIFNANRSKQLNDPLHFSKYTGSSLIVKINSEPVLKNDLYKFTATVIQSINGNKRQNTAGQLLISIKDTAASSLYYGDILLIPSNYNEVDPPFNPAEFNYKKYLTNKNIYHQAYLYPGQYRVLDINKGNPIISYALRLRQRLVQKLKANIHNPDAAAVAATLILGYKADLSNDILQAYSKTGTIHVLSVSGAHVGLVYLVLGFLLSFLDRYKHGRLIRTCIIIMLVWYYALLTGFSPPVCRAAVMLSLIVAGKTYSRYINTLNLLGFSAFALLLFDPFLITDVGFQLSYLAVAGLIVLQPVIYKWIQVKNKWLDKLWLLCSISIAAQVITFPLSAYYFHQIPVYFLFSNLFILIPSAAIMYTGIACLLLPEHWLISKWLAYVTEQLILLMNRVLAFVEHAPFASISKVWLTTAEYLLLYAIIITGFYFIYNKNHKLLKAGIGLLLLFCISISYKKYRAYSSSDVAFLNLRKHTGIVLRQGSEAVVITDIPADDKGYQYSVQPYLDSSKVATTTLANIDSNVKTDFTYKNAGLIKFRSLNILMLTHAANRLPASDINVHYVYVSGNPEIDIASLLHNNSCKMLIIAADNGKKLTNELVNAARVHHVKYYLLKRNKSFIAPSN
ncbi:ComEC/Rec2 family competence protein [Mucilaginibacter gynuensis]|uniref:ComEC/Rec2 family competence protein n=1 Tax=Mucilaginibacter gynuensis TaxID=1302236 RepID=A0ABP8H2T9_9SPHI